MPDKVRADYLEPGYFVDSDAETVVRFAKDTVAGLTGPRDMAVALYKRVRDEIRYDPYRLPPTRDEYKASATLAKGYGYCITKSALLAAAARAVGIPARVGYADVRNHLTSEKLRETMGTDLFVYHGYAEIYLDGKWLKATPVFNQTLCDKVGILPLEFDGTEDSIFHPFDTSGRRHMEYVEDRGTRADIPYEEIRDAFEKVYGWTDANAAAIAKTEARFEDEAEAS